MQHGVFLECLGQCSHGSIADPSSEQTEHFECRIAAPHALNFSVNCGSHY
eukprot:m.217137 g.217137  ORF g.217137 m.217137 type:complete len:50 (+) comp15597_c2_seq3:139-288(+)